MTDLIIRTGEAADLPTLVEFNQAMAMETEGKQLDAKTLTRGVQTLLNNPNLGFYLLARRRQQVVGSLMITEEWSDWRAQRFWWIQSVYVVPEARRTGVYRGLYDEVKRLAQEHGDVCGFRLYVEKDNRTAQKTYQQLGMSESYYLMFESH